MSLNDLRSPLTIRGITLPNRLILAPVDGVFDAPFRAIFRQMGVGLTVSEMISARSIGHAGHVLKEKAARAEAERPFAVQLCDHDPDYLARAAARVIDEGWGELIDLNLGCPSKQVTGSGNGSALLRDPPLVARLVRAMRAATTAPLSVKIRSGWDAGSINFMEIGHIAQEEGADWLVFHPRTRAQMFGSHADWAMIAEMKAALRIPLIGNGDVNSAESARRLLNETGCDGVMVARAAFGDPWLIRRILENDDTLLPSHEERLALILDHLARHRAFLPERAAVTSFRKHVGPYVKGLRGASAFRDQAMRIPSTDELAAAFRRFFAALGE